MRKYLKENAARFWKLIVVFLGFAYRLQMVFADKFLHHWDERYHALVAKNMVAYPFKPMLYVDPVLPYQFSAWCCNHIWLHKQPLFLWQIALSIRFFGANEWAVRLPSVFLGTATLVLCYSSAKIWMKDHRIALLSAAFFAVSFYQVELVSGRYSLDHNDVSFSFYVFASIWGLIKLYQTNHRKYIWLIGLCAGAAILVKWLTGLLVYSAWVVVILMLRSQLNLRAELKKILAALTVTVAVFVPWQLYILYAFPQEAAEVYEHNARHIFEVIEGHLGSIFYYLEQLVKMYGQVLWLLLIPGIIAIKNLKKKDEVATLAFSTAVVVLYGFFTIVATKMTAFVNPVTPILWIVIAAGLVQVLDKLRQIRYGKVIQGIFVLVVLYFAISPMRLLKPRVLDWDHWVVSIKNTKIYKKLNLPAGSIVLNCQPLEEVELMFYQDVIAYSYFPSKEDFNIIRASGKSIYAFENNGVNTLPDWLLTNKEVTLIEDELQAPKE